MAPKTWVRSISPWTTATTSSSEAPPAADSAAARAINPWPMVTERGSMTRTGTWSETASAAAWAAWYVADRAPDKLMHTTPS